MDKTTTDKPITDTTTPKASTDQKTTKTASTPASNPTSARSRYQGLKRLNLPLTMLVSMLTAVVVCLFFLVGFALFVLKSPQKDPLFKGAFAAETSASKAEQDDYGFVKLSAGAATDMINGNHKGLLYISTNNCDDCNIFAAKLKDEAAKEKTTIYHLNLQSLENLDGAASALVGYLDLNNTPAFLAVKDGRAFDRLDDLKSDANLSVFLGHYR